MRRMGTTIALTPALFVLQLLLLVQTVMAMEESTNLLQRSLQNAGDSALVFGMIGVGVIIVAGGIYFQIKLSKELKQGPRTPPPLPIPQMGMGPPPMDNTPPPQMGPPPPDMGLGGPPTMGGEFGGPPPAMGGGARVPQMTIGYNPPPPPMASMRMGSGLPPGWKSTIDSSTGDTYYYNRQMGIVQWDYPY